MLGTSKLRYTNNPTGSKDRAGQPPRSKQALTCLEPKLSLSNGVEIAFDAAAWEFL